MNLRPGCPRPFFVLHTAPYILSQFTHMHPLQEDIQRTFADSATKDAAEARRIFAQFRDALTAGEIRAAEKRSDGTWQTNAWVKQGILLGFRLGTLVEMGDPSSTYPLAGDQNAVQSAQALDPSDKPCAFVDQGLAFATESFGVFFLDVRGARTGRAL